MPFYSKMEVIMIGKLFSAARDCLLLCTLIALVQIALEQNVSFILEHKQSITHELDRDFIDQIYTAQRHIHALEQYPEYDEAVVTAIADIKSRLATIEEHYKKNSPGLTLLGPIGTCGIVIKEEKLKNKLLAVVNDISALLHTINHQVDSFQPALTVDNGLNLNKNALKMLLA